MNIFRFLGFIKRRRYWRRFIFFLVASLCVKNFFYNCIFYDLYVVGRKRTPSEDIKKCCLPFYKTPLLSINLESIHQQLSKLLWIKSVVIKRHFPDTICLKIEEREPIALWFYKKKNYLVDDEGNVLLLKNIEKEFQNLFFLFGDDAFKEFPQLLKDMKAYPHILKRVTHFTLIRKRRWDLFIDNTILVKMPDKNIKEALDRLCIILENYDFKVIDLRIPQSTFVISDEKI